MKSRKWFRVGSWLDRFVPRFTTDYIYIHGETSEVMTRNEAATQNPWNHVVVVAKYFNLFGKPIGLTSYSFTVTGESRSVE